MALSPCGLGAGAEPKLVRTFFMLYVMRIENSRLGRSLLP